MIPRGLNIFLNMQTAKFIYSILLLAMPCLLSAQDITLKKDLLITDKHVTLSRGPSSIQLEVNSESNIFIINKTQNSIWLYNNDGKLEKKVARQGRGPGEFVSLLDSFMGRGDTLFVLDRNLAKISIFPPPSYEPANMIKIKPLYHFYEPQKVFVNSEGICLVTYIKMTSAHRPKEKKKFYIV
jgi:hypothetical protein